MFLKNARQCKVSPKQPAKILVVGAHAGKGGAYVDRYIPSLLKAGYQVTFVGWDRDRKLPRSHTENNVLYRMIFRGWGYANKKLAIALPLWGIRLFFHLLFHKPDLIFALDLDCAFPACLANSFRFRHIPVLYAIVDTYALRPTIPKRLRKPMQMVDNWVVKKVDSVIVPDETRILEEYEHKDKFVVIYNCCKDISNHVPTEKKVREGKPFTILATGNITEGRGIKLLLQAARELPDMHILMAGYIFSDDIKEMIDSSPNATFLGRLPLNKAYCLNFDADAVFTFYDPGSEINRRAASNKWADAMMASRPILVNSEIIKAEWIRKNDMGYLCPYGDVGSLVKCLKQILDNPEDRIQKGRNGRRLFEEGYNWDTMEIRLWNLLESLTVRF